MELFPYLKNLYEKTEVLNSNTDFKTHFQIIRYLSLYKPAFYQAQEANRLSAKLPNWAVSCLLFYTVPFKSRAPFVKYPKSENVKLSNIRKNAIKRISSRFCCSEYHACQTLVLLEEQDINIEGS